MMAMIPFWWFPVMDPLVDAYQNLDRPPTKEQLDRANYLSKLGLVCFMVGLTLIMILAYCI